MPPKTRKRKGEYLTKNQVQRMIQGNQETKRLDVAWNGVSIPSGGIGAYTINLINLSQGPGEQQRVGDQIFITGMYGRFQITGADATNIARVLIYIPRDTDDVLSSIETYQDPDPSLYTVLYDRTVTLTANGEFVKQITCKLNFRRGNRRGIRVKYAGATTTPTWNNIKMVATSDSGAVTHPTLSGHLNLYMKDS